MTDENIIVVSSEVMNKRVANFEDQIPNKTMLITQRMEGYKRDIYSIIEFYSTVTDLAKFLGLSISHFFNRAT